IKYFTDQTLMKSLKQELQELQKKMKSLRNNPKKMAEVNNRVMEANMKYMSHSMKPTLYTFIPIILVFSWMGAHVGYYPLTPGEPFQLTAVFEENTQGQVSLVLPEGLTLVEGNLNSEVSSQKLKWTLSGDSGEYIVDILFNDKKYTTKVIVTDEQVYAPVEKSFKKSFIFFSSADENGLNAISLSNKQILPFEDVPIIKDIPWISTWGWFGTYFLFSIIFSMGLRKAMNIY
ncbi:MAG: EMC3/TMCO1 family protein, partial [Nanoarchaeota archaeon]